MITLAQAQQLTQSKLTSFIIDEFRRSALLDALPFDNCVTPQGGRTLAYVYNRIITQATAAPRAINAEYVAQEAATQQYTVNLKVFGGAFELDRVIALNERKLVDHVQFQLQQKIKATIALFHDMFINGDSGIAGGTQFDGLDKALTGSITELSPASAIELDTSAHIDSNWKAFLDNLRKVQALMDESPSMLLMNKTMYAVFQSVMDRAGISLLSKTNYGTEVSQWGSALVMALGDKPASSNPVIETAAGITDIYFVRLGLDGVHGVSPDGDTLVKEYLPDMTREGAVKKGEVEMVAAMAVKATKSAAVLRNIATA